MLGKPSPPFFIPGLLDNIKINKYAKFDSNILYSRSKSYEGFQLTDHNRLDNFSAKPYVSKMGGFACHVDMHQYAKYYKICHVVQGL